MPRTINPLGIRKLDVQAARRAAENDSRDVAVRMVDLWTRGGTEQLDEVEITRLVRAAYMRGWEAGTHTGAKATRDRVAEALERGTLVKP